MAWRLTPKDDRFYAMFANAAENLVTGARLLQQQMTAHVDSRPAIAVKMRETEHAGDDATHELFSTVNSTFVTPFDREDIYALAGRLDDVLDHMDAAADLVVLYRPVEIPEGVGQQIDVLCRAADLTVDAMHRLRTPQELSGYWVEINRLENEADAVHRRMIGELFEHTTDPIRLLKVKEIIENLEEAADAFEQVSHHVETIAVKES
jgi:predicted phosphate transport protein (TIGR00153 family)